MIFSKAIAVTCVCCNGVWELTNGDCDSTVTILTGYGDCWDLKGAMKTTFKYVGRASTAFSPATYIASEWMDAFWKLPSGSKSSREIINLPRLNFISIFNSDKVISARNTACCKRSEENQKLPVHICFGAPTGNYMLRSKCHPSADGMTELRSIGLDFGQAFDMGTQKIIAPSANCWSCGNKATYQFDTGCCPAIAWEDDDDYALVDTKRYDKQTNRIVGAHLEFVLRNRRSFTLDTFEFKQLRYAAGILNKVCPEESLPKDLLKTFLRFFKQAVNESMRDFPMEKTMDSLQNDRIMAALDKCLANTMQPWELKTRGSCDKPIYQVKDGDNFTDAEMPEYQTFDSERFDLVMEIAWKLIQFIHYFCAAEFEQNPADASYLVTGLERFFNADLTRRWTNPGRSYQVFKFLLPTYNLKEFMKTLDACVAAAKKLKSSGRNKPWLIRPFLRKRIVNTKSTRVWNQTGTCLTSYWFPDNSYVNKCGRNDATLSMTNSI
ncbi:unnamed protein product [Allacma fusca]|uniref:Uncharacterized protein n=1 Tax=Allacma fusca TaxID=39272 RepID=A0A8J2Q2N2_9HEXA|nr:unnamed protein product [Allacma fusca]